MVAHGLAQLFLMTGKMWFNVANTACYLTTAFFVCTLARACSIKSYIILVLILWCILPVPGSSIFWLTGSCNYLWSSMLTAAWIAALFNKNKKIQIASLPVAILAGNSHEGISICILSAIFIYTALNRTTLKNKRYICSVLMFTLGAASNILAPGNFVRLESSHTASLNLMQKLSAVGHEIMGLSFKVINATDDTIYCFFLIPIGIIANAYAYKEKKEANTLSISLIGGAIIGIGLPLMSGCSYPRAYFGTAFVAILGSSAIVLPWISQLSRHLYLGLLYLATLCSLSSANSARQTIIEYSETEEYIGRKIAAGDKIIITPPENRHLNSRYIEAWGHHGRHLMNKSMARYYNGSDVAVYSADAGAQIEGILSKINQIELWGEFEYFRYEDKLVSQLPKGIDRICISQKSANKDNKNIPFASFVYHDKTYVVLDKLAGDIEISYTKENGKRERVCWKITEI